MKFGPSTSRYVLSSYALLLLIECQKMVLPKEETFEHMVIGQFGLPLKNEGINSWMLYMKNQFLNFYTKLTDLQLSS